MDPFYRAAKRLMLLNSNAGEWGMQSLNRKWTTCKFAMRKEHVEGHFEGRHWIGTKLRADQATDRLIFDIDCKTVTDETVRDLTLTLHRLLEFFGHEPLVYGTPTGKGIRVAYRIPETDPDYLRKTDTKGLVCEVLQHEGFTLGPSGDIEILPARNKLDRQMFGRSMPFLNPRTLEPVVRTQPGEPYTLSGLKQAITLVGEWYENVCGDLVADLEGRARQIRSESIRAESTRPRSRNKVAVRSTRSPTPAKESRRQSDGAPPFLVLHHGLQQQGSRYDMEFKIGARIWAWPEHFGLENPTEEEVASELVGWLHIHHNNLSEEWTEALLTRTEAAAFPDWQTRYLAPGPDGSTPISRMRRASESLRRGPTGSIELSGTDFLAIEDAAARLCLHLVEKSGSDRYRFEIWAASAVRMARRQIRRGGKSGDAASGMAQIKAEWLEELPFGANHLRYRQAMEKSGMMRPVRAHRWEPESERGSVSTIYQLATPFQPPWASHEDLPMPPEVMAGRIRGLQTHGRSVLPIEGYHAAHKDRSERRSTQMYGKSGAQTIVKIRRVVVEKAKKRIRF